MFRSKELRGVRFWLRGILTMMMMTMLGQVELAGFGAVGIVIWIERTTFGVKYELTLEYASHP